MEISVVLFLFFCFFVFFCFFFCFFGVRRKGKGGEGERERERRNKGGIKTDIFVSKDGEVLNTCQSLDFAWPIRCHHR